MATNCRSIVGIWSETPPSHCITAITSIDGPPTLYTGASDGSVVWWHISSSKIEPVAMLCGHVAPIVDLCISYPLLVSLDEKFDQSRGVGLNRLTGDQAALVSVCSGGVLCVWSRGSGHCRSRRKLPPWVGSPSIVQPLPTSKRFICLASCFTEISQASDPELFDSAEGIEVTGNEESLSRKAPKCTVVIIDSYSLNIVQTVFLGHLSISHLKFMEIVESVDDNQKYSTLLIDPYGKSQCIPLVKESNLKKEGGPKLHQDSSLVKTATAENGPYDGELVISVSTYGQLLGLVYKTRCIFLLVDCATVIGVIFLEDNSHQSHLAGGMFITSDNTCTSESEKAHNLTGLKFAVWDDRGSVKVYELSYGNDAFKFEISNEIPATTCPMDVKLVTNFVQLRNYFLRVESVCYRNEEPSLWKPHVTIWSLHQQLDDHEKFGKNCRLLGEGNFFVGWVNGSSDAINNEAPGHTIRETSASGEPSMTKMASVLDKRVTSTSNTNDLNYTSIWKESSVSSTMVISISVQTPSPYAIVYGYHSGHIELIQLNLLAQKIDSDGVNVHPELESQGSKKHFSGHTGSVVCLAAHQIGTSTEQACSKVLLSGSMDCTLRVWDLETCNAIMVMHHHVAPVRQIILPPLQSYHPWNKCFLSVGEDCCVALVSLETLQVERMFPGHPSYPLQVVWDGVRGYLACLSQNQSVASGAKDVLYIWDIKAGSRERVLRSAAAHSMFNNFCKAMGTSNISGYPSNYNTSRASLIFSLTEDGGSLSSNLENTMSKSSSEVNLLDRSMSSINSNGSKSVKLSTGNHDKLAIRCSCPISGIAILSFDLSALLSNDVCGDGGKHWNASPNESQQRIITSNDPYNQGNFQEIMEDNQHMETFRLCLLQFSLSFLHLWGVDVELDHLLVMEMNLKRYKSVMSAPGLEGDGGSITLSFPAFSSVLQLWQSSSEFCAMRSLTVVSLAQSLVSLSHFCSGASSALSAFYTRNFAEKVPDVKPPSLQLLASFWQDEDEHVRLAARSLFHCAASRAIPPPLCCSRTEHTKTVDSQVGEAEILKWLESYELQDWISCVGGTSQDAMASHIIVASALAVWYPSLVKTSLAALVVHPLIKLVMSMNEKYSCTAAELLAEGMESTWKECIGAEIHGFTEDIFFQIECVSGASTNTSSVAAAVPPKLRETLVSILLPSLALVDIPGFLSVVEGLIWSTASDSPVHLVSLMTLMRLMRGSARNLALYLNKVVNFILHTMDPANTVMRKTCLQSSMATLREVVRVYPMVALNDSSTRLAVGDAIAEVNSANIHVYDMQSVTKIKVLDASGPPGIPSFLSGAPETVISAISALTFSPDGEGLVAFSEHGLIIRWWSLGTGWWEKLSRNFIPIQCTKLIFVPPWEGFSPNSSRASIMANIAANGRHSQVHTRSSDVEGLNLLLYNLDLSYKLEWIGDRQVCLTRHGQELGTFLL
ncbi:WD repeat-containing protein 72 [Bienertia sinuspersici]